MSDIEAIVSWGARVVSTAVTALVLASCSRAAITSGDQCSEGELRCDRTGVILQKCSGGRWDDAYRNCATEGKVCSLEAKDCVRATDGGDAASSDASAPGEVVPDAAGREDSAEVPIDAGTDTADPGASKASEVLDPDAVADVGTETTVAEVSDQEVDDAAGDIGADDADAIADSGTDVISTDAVSDSGNGLTTCGSATDCAGSFCVAVAGGATYCALDCTSDVCPTGWSCATDPKNAWHRLCSPDAPPATCGDFEGWTRPCSVTNGQQQCSGIATCAGAGWSDCSVGLTVAESCNGVDDDCDGFLDEDFPTKGVPCVVGVNACAVTGKLECAADGKGLACSVTVGAPAETLCDDGDACTKDDHCTGGAASLCAGTAYACDDALTCTSLTCDGKGACVTTVTAGTCLVDGVCYVHGALDPTNACRQCAPASTTAFTNSADGLACGVCAACVAGSCDAALTRHGDCGICQKCVAKGVCDVQASTDDLKDECGTGDGCMTGTCDGGGACGKKLDGTACDDGVGCIAHDRCASGTCAATSPCCAANADCDDQNACTIDVCKPAGDCGHAPAPDGATCSDGSLCTSGDACSGGTCAGAPAVTCNDGNGCTDDACVSATGLCAFANNAGTCSDGNPCTTGDTCSGGACQGMAVQDGTTCDDANKCTVFDACAAGTCAGVSIEVASTCDDGSACTKDECLPTSGCKNQPRLFSKLLGKVGISEPRVAVHGDGSMTILKDRADLVGTDPYGVETWSWDYGGPWLISEAVLVASDVTSSVIAGSARTAKFTPYDLLWLAKVDIAGTVLWEKTYASAGSRLAGATAHPSGGYVLASESEIFRLDGGGSVVWQKPGGVGRVTAIAVATDHSVVYSTEDSTIPSGEGHCGLKRMSKDGDIEWTRTFVGSEPRSCQDLAELPDGGFVIAGYARPDATEHDGFALRTDVDGKVLWERTFDSGGIDLFRSVELSSAGRIALVGLTDDSASGGDTDGWLVVVDVLGAMLLAIEYKQPGYGDFYGSSTIPGGGLAIVGIQYDEVSERRTSLIRTDHWGNASCAESGACVDKPLSDCDDGKPCTADLCDAAAGCTHAPLPGASPCDDGSKCTTDDHCTLGLCAGAPVTCVAIDDCHDNGTCAPTTGTCSTPTKADSTPCSDANPCTTNDACSAGVCAPGALVTCDDTNPCTSDLCQPATGACVHEPMAAGAPCGGGKACYSGACVLCTPGFDTVLGNGAGDTAYEAVALSEQEAVLVGGIRETAMRSWIGRVSASGVVTKFYLGPEGKLTDDVLYTVAARADGVVMAAGQTNVKSGESVVGNELLIRVDSSGQHLLPGDPGRVILDITALSDGSWAVTGMSTGYVKRIDDEGQKLDGFDPGKAWGHAVVELPGNGGFILAGYGPGFMLAKLPKSNWSAVTPADVVKVTGDAQWNAHDAVLGHDGHLWVVGQIASGKTARTLWRVEPATLAITSTTLLGGAQDDVANYIAYRGTDYVIAGTSTPPGEARGYELLGLDLSGGQRWSRSIPGSVDYDQVGFTVFPSGQLLLAGKGLRALRMGPWGHFTCKEAGACAGKAVLDCDDQNPCTADLCDAAAGCTHAPLSDGAACGSEAVCGGGDCGPSGYALIPAGTFLMGSPESEPGHQSDETRHEVTLTGAFWLKATEVTQAEWEAVMGTQPSYFSSCGKKCPVERVSWFDAVAYLNALSQAESLTACYAVSGCTGTAGSGCPTSFECTGDYACTSVASVSGCTGYRLPTEAEWEFAARGGTTGGTYAGTTDGANLLCEEPNGVLDGIAWFCGNADGGPHPAGEKASPKHPWGLFDMLGNVWEWTADRYGPYVIPASPNPSGPTTGSYRVDRGGSWGDSGSYLRSATRSSYPPGNRTSYLGFRAARTVP